MLFALLKLTLLYSLLQAPCSKAEITFIEVKYPLLGTPAPPGTPWPKPQFMNGSDLTLSYLSKAQFKFNTNLKVECDIITENLKLYTNVLFPPLIYSEPVGVQDAKLIKCLDISIAANIVCPAYPDSNIDESYTLQILAGKAKLEANSVWGAIRGLETFSQLTFYVDNKLALNDSTLVSDFPRFQYRGLLLDTARHFLPVPILKKQLDAMAYHKLNVFHWHIVDDQSFPFESRIYPSLTEKGRYSPAHVYKQSDVKAIINHARLRGIRVIPEFDTPGHVNAFGRTFPQFITVCWKDGKPYQAIYSVQGKAEILNPTLEGLYPVLKNVLAEFKEIFPDEYIHLGNDEVYYDCWKSNPDIQKWMIQMNFTEYHQLEAYYSTRLLELAGQLNKKVTVWQDVYDNGVRLDKSTQIQIWKDTSILPEHKKWYQYMEDITSNGYKVILSSPWYINLVSYGYQEWYKWYSIEPFSNFKGTEEQRKLVLGGEIALWTEYVDGANIASRLWPRASAIAERLWSSAYVNDPEEAKFRLDEQRCRLLRRGIPASPVLNGYCGDYEYGMEKSVVYDPVFNYNWPSL